ncbi:MAG: serine/threonine protein kinase, partial [Deltaproteobacteria bacterium]|nr:serine/threonine protein kinase [Deltaproteobacteria bacterium]
MNEQLGNGGGRLQGPPGPGGPPGRGGERVIPFGKYLLVDRIAVGGMAEVYTAKSFGVEGFEKILAIKRILPTMAEDEDFIQMFIDEAKIAGQLTHANVVPIYELGKIGDSHYIAMEYVWGKDLLQIMNRFRKMRKQMPASMGAWIGAKMCEGLDYAHRKKDRSGRPLGIIHRDVSPQNCLVSYEGQVKMIDFGIAKAASRNTKTQAGVLKGKFGYMSPEQVRGLPVDHRSDIFAVGTCLYEMLTTERLFVGESDFSTLEKVRNAQVPALSLQVPDIPKELEDIVMKALARDVENRWQSAAEMQEALQRFIARERPPFGTSKLAAWMRTAFAPEMAKEKQRLDSFAKIGPPAAPPPSVPQRPVVAVKPPPSEDDEPEELAGEATMMTASPFEEDGGGGGHGHGHDEILEQATQIFFSADEVQEVDPVRPTMAAAPAGPAPAPRIGGGIGGGQAVVQQAPRPVGLPPPGGMRPQPMVSVGGPPATAPAPSMGPSVQVAGMSGYPPPIQQQQPMMQPPMGMQPIAQQQPMMHPGMQQQQPMGMQPMQPGMQQPMMQQPGMQQPGMQQPGMQQPFGAPPPPAVPQRTDTMQLQAPPANFAQPGVGPAPERSSRRGLIGFFAVAALGMLGVGLFGGYWFFLRGPGLGTIEVRAVPVEAATAQVSLDGQPRGHAPIRIEGVLAGEHVLVLSQPGFTDVTRPVTVTENGVVALDVALSPAVAIPAVAAVVPAVVPTPVPPTATAVAAIAPTTDP